MNNAARKFLDNVGLKTIMPYSIKHSVITDAMNEPDSDYNKLSDAVHINESTLQKHYRLTSRKDNPLVKLTYKNLPIIENLEEKAGNQ